jgi:hypothetical protein
MWVGNGGDFGCRNGSQVSINYAERVDIHFDLRGMEGDVS